jgi:hypothetical protein
MSSRKLLISLAALAALAAPVGAQAIKGAGVPLKEAEAKKALLGIDMQGFSPTYQMAWRECIQPNGETLYETPDEVLKGKLSITPKGEACFAYEDTDYSTVACFRMFRSGKVLRFEGDNDELFVTTRVTTGIKNCKPKSLVS